MTKKSLERKVHKAQAEIRKLRESGNKDEAKRKEREELSPLVEGLYLTYYTNPIIMINHGCKKAERL